MTPYLLSRLAVKRAALAQRLERAQAVVAKIGADIDLIDARVRQQRVAKRAKRTQLTRGVLDILRASAQPMPLRPLVLCLMAQNGQDVSNPSTVRTMIERTRTALGKQRKAGLVRSEAGEGQTALWGIAR